MTKTKTRCFLEKEIKDYLKKIKEQGIIPRYKPLEFITMTFDIVSSIDKEEVNMFKTNAEAVICGETYDVKIVCGPDEFGLCQVDVPFEDGEFVERLAVIKANIWPQNEEAVSLLMN